MPSLGLSFAIALGVAVLVYVLRGLGILTFLPGGLVVALFAVALVLGLLVATRSRR